MELNIIEDKDNFLFNRKEVKVVVKAEKNPSFEEAADIISGQFKADKESIVIKLVQGKFGRNTFLISGFIYKTKEDKEKFEPKKREKKKAEGEGGEAAPAQPAAPAVEEKKEEKKEEAPAEEKKEEPKPAAEEKKVE